MREDGLGTDFRYERRAGSRRKREQVPALHNVIEAGFVLRAATLRTRGAVSGPLQRHSQPHQLYGHPVLERE